MTLTPLWNKPKVTEVDIKRGYVDRYFLQNISTKAIVEVDKKQYMTLKRHALYSPLAIEWKIAGYANDIVAKDGKLIRGTKHVNTVLTNFHNTRMPGLNRILRNPLEYFVGVTNAEPVLVSSVPTTQVSNFTVSEMITTTTTLPPTPVLVWTEIAYDTVPTRGSNVNLSTTTPDGTLDSGWTSYSYSVATNYLAMTYGSIKANAANPVVIYPNVNFDHNNIRLYCNVSRLSTDRTGSGMRLQLFSSSGDSIALRVALTRQTAGATVISVQGVDSVGTVTELMSSTSPNLGAPGTYTIILEVEGDTVNAYYASAGGAAIEDATLIGTAALPSYITALDRNSRTFALQSTGATTQIAEHYVIGSISVWNKI